MKAETNETFLDRLAGVISLKRPTYETLQRDPAATPQSWLIVLFIGLANGIALISTPLIMTTPGASVEMERFAAGIAQVMTFDSAERQLLALLAGVIIAAVSWYLTAWLICVIGNRMAANAGAKIGTEEMRRLVAWGYAPALASFLSPIPVVGPFLALFGALWGLVTGVMAVRAAFDISIGRAIAIEFLAFLAFFLLAIILITIIVLIALPSF